MAPKKERTKKQIAATKRMLAARKKSLKAKGKTPGKKGKSKARKTGALDALRGLIAKSKGTRRRAKTGTSKRAAHSKRKAPKPETAAQRRKRLLSQGRHGDKQVYASYLKDVERVKKAHYG